MWRRRPSVRLRACRQRHVARLQGDRRRTSRRRRCDAIVSDEIAADGQQPENGRRRRPHSLARLTDLPAGHGTRERHDNRRRPHPPEDDVLSVGTAETGRRTDRCPRRGGGAGRDHAHPRLACRDHPERRERGPLARSGRGRSTGDRIDVRRSTFDVRRSRFDVRRSVFVVRGSPLVVRRRGARRCFARRLVVRPRGCPTGILGARRRAGHLSPDQRRLHDGADRRPGRAGARRDAETEPCEGRAHALPRHRRRLPGSLRRLERLQRRAHDRRAERRRPRSGDARQPRVRLRRRRADSADARGDVSNGSSPTSSTRKPASRSAAPRLISSRRSAR